MKHEWLNATLAAALLAASTLPSSASAAERCGTSDEIAAATAFLLGEHAAFITGTNLLIDGGVIASIRAGTYSIHP